MACSLAKVLALISLFAAAGCTNASLSEQTARTEAVSHAETQPPAVRKLMESAKEQVRVTRGYTQDYFVLAYPGGDPPPETGACTDVVIRSFRNVGVDLQREVHQDMVENFSSYPSRWGLRATDKNIDHRRVPNLQTFFTRQGKSLPVTNIGRSYEPGDVVTWDLNGKGMTHIGLVSDLWNERTGRYLIIHNIGGGTNAEDRLFDWKITGHFRYF